jgi:hypothetical protein
MSIPQGSPAYGAIAIRASRENTDGIYSMPPERGECKNRRCHPGEGMPSVHNNELERKVSDTLSRRALARCALNLSPSSMLPHVGRVASGADIVPLGQGRLARQAPAAATRFVS